MDQTEADNLINVVMHVGVGSKTRCWELLLYFLNTTPSIAAYYTTLDIRLQK
jgi:hypothetical protein